MAAAIEANPAVESAEPDQIVAGRSPRHLPPPRTTRTGTTSGAAQHRRAERVVAGHRSGRGDRHCGHRPDQPPGPQRQDGARYDFLSDTYHSRDGNGRDANPQDQGPEPGWLSWRHGSHVAGIAAAQDEQQDGHRRCGPRRADRARTCSRVDGRGHISDIADGVMLLAGIPDPGSAQEREPGQGGQPVGGVDSCCPAAMQNVINRMHKINVPLVAAAGNAAESANLASPATAGADRGRPRRTEPAHGYTNWVLMLDVWRPGDAGRPSGPRLTRYLPSASRPTETLVEPPWRHRTCGVIAIMKERNPDLGVEAIRVLFRSTGTSRERLPQGDVTAAAGPSPAPDQTVHGAIATYYNAHGGAAAMAPTTWSRARAGVGGVVQTFTNGRVTKIYWSHETGAHKVETWKGIGTRYSQLGGPDHFRAARQGRLPTATGGLPELRRPGRGGPPRLRVEWGDRHSTGR
ncbi:subtilisin [Kocuria rhizophila]|nr:subtilisin [Kocuria rhizophila]